MTDADPGAIRLRGTVPQGPALFGEGNRAAVAVLVFLENARNPKVTNLRKWYRAGSSLCEKDVLGLGGVLRMFAGGERKQVFQESFRTAMFILVDNTRDALLIILAILAIAPHPILQKILRKIPP